MERHPPQLRTPGVIAAELGVSLAKVLYILRHRGDIRPIGRAGTLRLYDRSAVDLVRAALAQRSQSALGRFNVNPPSTVTPFPTTALTIPEVARLLRVSRDKVRRWVESGQLNATNVAGAVLKRPRWVILPNQLDAFVNGRSSSPPPKQTRKRKLQSGLVDFYPD